MTEKQPSKKLNFIFFIDHGTTKHLKINFLPFKIIVVFLIIYFVASIVLFFTYYKQILLVKEQTNYIHAIKENSLKEFFVGNFGKDNSKNNLPNDATTKAKQKKNELLAKNDMTAEEQEVAPENVEDSEIDTDVIPDKAPINTKPALQNSKVEEKKQYSTLKPVPTVNQQIPAPAKPSLTPEQKNAVPVKPTAPISNVQDAAAVKGLESAVGSKVIVSKIKTAVNRNQVYLSFLLSKTDKLLVEGKICVIISTKNSKALIFPLNLELNAGAPKNCNGGEKIKFNKLRPTKLAFYTFEPGDALDEVFIFLERADGKEKPGVELLHHEKIAAK